MLLATLSLLPYLCCYHILTVAFIPAVASTVAGETLLFLHFCCYAAHNYCWRSATAGITAVSDVPAILGRPCYFWHPFNIVSVHTVCGVPYGADALAVVGVPTIADVPAIASDPDIAGDLTAASLSTDTGALVLKI
jgi:hypothetical protein